MIKTKTAYKMGIEALRRQRWDHAFGRNLYKAGVTAISTKRDWSKYEKFTEAMEILQKESEK